MQQPQVSAVLVGGGVARFHHKRRYQKKRRYAKPVKPYARAPGTPPQLLWWAALGVTEAARFIKCDRTPTSVSRVGVCGVLALYRKPHIL